MINKIKHTIIVGTRAFEYIVFERLFKTSVQVEYDLKAERASKMKNTLDNIDEKIIELLQANARIAIKDIAAEVFLSSPAVTARIERLEAKGIIKGYHAAIDSVNLGYKIKAFVNLDLEPVQKEDFYPFIQNVDNVVECSCVTGEYSMIMQVEFSGTEELDEFINHLQKFGKTRTQIVFSTPVEHRGIPVRPFNAKY